MLLVYLVLEAERFSEYDAHYFPGADLRITRLSEPKNYADVAEPRGTTVLCAELPCQTEDAVWSMSDAELGEIVRDDLARAGIPVHSAVRRVEVKRLSHAYPLYPRGYESHFTTLVQLGGGPAAGAHVRPSGPVRPRQHPPRAVHGALGGELL